MAELCDRYMADYATEHKRTAWRDQMRIDNVIKPWWGSRPAREITKDDIMALRRAMKSIGVTFNRTRAMLSKIFNFAEIEPNPVKRAPAFTEHGVVMAATILNSDVALLAMRTVIEVFVAQKQIGALAPSNAGSLVPRLQRTLEGLLDSIVDHRTQTTVREEAQALLAQSIQHLKDRLGRQGLENEEMAARATKLLAEAEATKAVAAKTQAEAGEIELRVLARKLRLVIEAERAMAAQDLSGFLGVLEDLSRVEEG